MEPDGKKPMAIAAVAILFIIVVFVKGSPLVRFQLITALFARWRNKRNAQAAVSNNNSRSAYTSIRYNRIFVAIFGRPVSIPTVDVEQAGTPPHFDPSVSTPSLPQPPPAYTRHHTDVLYIGAVTRNRPLVNPPAYTPPLPSSSLRIAPSTVAAN
ncbi:hypothetical protein FS837_007717 [Tulasnella sp. UAMH 9824]|nr:hypothetical protein FS837_007717 [Tulasnella sp. UAMH 9824]